MYRPDASKGDLQQTGDTDATCRLGNTRTHVIEYLHPTPATTTTTTTPAPAAAVGTVVATAALVAQGKTLYTSTGCAACHSISGSAGVGPTFKGLAGSSVPLTNGQTVTATDAYLAQSISAPDAQIVKGYQAGVMSAAVAGYNLASNPDKIRALVAFIKAQK
jgi:cytochrome c oxidase subunit 2